ncbi:MAG: sigma-70 family RNA polymerase sigma factor [Muribaculaceae bacterium]|nr:sigma-70 family RNA polymerase sigma factor [Muribaculaceae bacterium]
MITGIKVNGVKEEKKKLSLKEEKEKLQRVSYFILRDVMENERENVMMMLMSGFSRLRYEDLEEVYSDGCLILWEKMMDDDYVLKKESICGFLRRVCWNIGRHYLRKVNDNVMSLDLMLDKGDESEEERSGIGEIFDVVDECDDRDEKYEKLEKIWERLSEVDRMILESYYVEGCKMEEIARRIGYKNGNSVKSKKNKVLKKIIEIRKEKEAEGESLPLAA